MNYVILDKSKDELSKIQDFLSTYFALYVFESTRYRMKYLEKYAFQFLPDLWKDLTGQGEVRWWGKAGDTEYFGLFGSAQQWAI